MNYTKKQIIQKAIVAMNQIEWDYDTSKEIDAVFTSKEKQIENAKTIKKHPKYKEYITTFKS